MPNISKNKKVIQAQNIHKYYSIGDSRIHVLKGIDIAVYEKEFVVIMGESGSGKSTLMHILGLLDRFDKGKLLIKGVDVKKLKDRHLSKFRGAHIGFVFQNFNLLAKYSVLDNVLLPTEYVHVPNAKQKAIDLLKRLGLGHRINYKPNKLSGGQRQRVAIARALITDPALILADEPTGNLDSQTGHAIMELFKELNDSGKTIVLITHNPKMRKWGHRTIYLKDGKIVDKLDY